MVGAIGLARHRPPAAEVEVLVAGVTVRPHADRTAELEDVAPRRRLYRDHAGHQAEAMHLADHRIFGDADAAADLGGGHAFIPEKGQLLDALGCPSPSG